MALMTPPQRPAEQYAGGSGEFSKQMKATFSYWSAFKIATEAFHSSEGSPREISPLSPMCFAKEYISLQQ